MSCSAEALIFELHGKLLRSLSSATQTHFQGLAQASRHLRTRGLISSAAAKKLHNIDGAYNLCRHITTVSSRTFADQVMQEVQQSSSRASSEALPLECCQTPAAPELANDRHDDCPSSVCCKDTFFKEVPHPFLVDTPALEAKTGNVDEKLITKMDPEDLNRASDPEKAFVEHLFPQCGAVTLGACAEVDELVGTSALAFLDRCAERHLGVFQKFYFHGRHQNRGKRPNPCRTRRNSIVPHRLAENRSADFWPDSKSNTYKHRKFWDHIHLDSD